MILNVQLILYNEVWFKWSNYILICNVYEDENILRIDKNLHSLDNRSFVRNSINICELRKYVIYLKRHIIELQFIWYVVNTIDGVIFVGYLDSFPSLKNLICIFTYESSA